MLRRSRCVQILNAQSGFVDCATGPVFSNIIVITLDNYGKSCLADKLGTDPMVYGDFINGRRRGTREDSRR